MWQQIRGFPGLVLFSLGATTSSPLYFTIRLLQLKKILTEITLGFFSKGWPLPQASQQSAV